jgi:tetratricopeptide (TPR) repeat protein
VNAQTAAAPVSSKLNAADQTKFDEAINLINSWSGSGDHFQQAFAILADIATRNPQSAAPIAGLAELKFRLSTMNQGSPGEALQLANHALKLDPNNADAHIVVAKVMLGQDDWAAASRAADNAIRVAPEKPEAMFAKARVAEAARRYDEAEQWYRKSIDRLSANQRKANVYYYLGRMYKEKTPSDITRATEAYVKAGDLAEDAPWLLNSVGAFLVMNTEHYDLAITYLNKALGIMQFDMARINLGLAHYFKWGDAYMNPDKYRNARQKPLDPQAIVAATGIPPEVAFVFNPLVPGTPWATIAMLKLNMIKDVNVHPEVAEDNALVAAAHGNHLDIVKMLVAKGANVNAVDRRYKNTAVFYAVRHQNLEMVRFLVERGARINIEDGRRILLVEYAIMDSKPGDLSILTFLLNRGIDPMATTRTGSPLIAVAILHGNHAALELFLKQYKADPNTRTGGELGGVPILAIAATQTHASGGAMVKMLLDAGANPWVKYGGNDVLYSLNGAKEAFAGASDAPASVREANSRIVQAADEAMAMIIRARQSVPKPPDFGPSF